MAKTQKSAASGGKGKAASALKAPTDAELVYFYRQMLLIRRFEEKAG